ncbi:S-formylglutathione hydrolase [Kushneria phosphatilytica]|uniref:S-formylglutathione hydrolase n=1 Tax=Kushneria phosphatilytica TaxID=657387 RepID=A0A5C0ZZ06_9GAMM|nr:S-formylglutathione hydrolase [Kushneria phosphatilytica]QEL10623.1 S-formylglutathione hydrolase [Kushneria phosphatilytica]
MAQHAIERVSANKSFGGWVSRFTHYSEVLDCDMTFGIYLPPQAEEERVPLLWWLSGLTCTDENFMQKAGAQKLAAELGIAIICPDTSPRGTDLPGEHERFDFGSGAGFYVNATREPWSRHYRMYDYVTRELPELIREHFPLNGREAISGHSMGGHGALVCALRQPGRYVSVSAFSPVCHPVNCPWGEQAFSHYLGDDRALWAEYDACALIRAGTSRQPLLVEQGEDDNFLDEQLQPGELERTCQECDHELTLNYRPGYDHSYFFVASFIDDHLRYHARYLQAE